MQVTTKINFCRHHLFLTPFKLLGHNEILCEFFGLRGSVHPSWNFEPRYLSQPLATIMSESAQQPVLLRLHADKSPL